MIIQQKIQSLEWEAGEKGVSKGANKSVQDVELQHFGGKEKQDGSDNAVEDQQRKFRISLTCMDGRIIGASCLKEI